MRQTGDLEVSTLDAGPGMFDAYRVHVLAGRVFEASDVGAANAVVVTGRS